MHKFMCLLTAILIGSLSSNLFAQFNGENKLTINVAVDKTINNNPQLKALQKKIEIQKANKLQVGLLPNPEFEIEAENILGNNDFTGFRGSEITAIVSQNILLAGKINKLEKISDADISLAQWDYKIEQLKVITKVKKEFINALAVRMLIDKNSELIKISEKLISNLKERVSAGKISPAEVSRSQLILNSLQISINKLKSEYQNYIFELKTLINDPNFSFDSVDGELREMKDLPEYNSLLLSLEDNPSLKKFESEYIKQKAKISFEESLSIPNINVKVGYKRLNEVNANTFLVGASLPIPIFNRNQGSIQKAKIQLDEKTIEYKAIKNQLKLKLTLYYNNLKMLLSSAKKIQNESLPTAEETFKIILKGNQVGRFKILDVLDAQRTLFEIQNQYLITVGEINEVIVELEGLTLTSID